MTAKIGAKKGNMFTFLRIQLRSCFCYFSVAAYNLKCVHIAYFIPWPLAHCLIDIIVAYMLFSEARARASVHGSETQYGSAGLVGVWDSRGREVAERQGPDIVIPVLSVMILSEKCL